MAQRINWQRVTIQRGWLIEATPHELYRNHRGHRIDTWRNPVGGAVSLVYDVDDMRGQDAVCGYINGQDAPVDEVLSALGGNRPVPSAPDAERSPKGVLLLTARDLARQLACQVSNLRDKQLGSTPHEGESLAHVLREMSRTSWELDRVLHLEQWLTPGL